MVFTGKPSAGCENCRKSKKKCDLETPTCGRCIRLGKACGGYRDVTDMMFRDQSASVLRRLGASEASSSTPGPSTQPGPDWESMVQAFFHQQFIAPGHLAFLEDVTPNEFLSRPMQACAMVVLANRQGRDARLRELARQHYVAAIAATNEALRDPRKVKEDNTLVAVFMLGIYERMDWERHQSKRSLNSHIHGLAMVLQLRGRDQIHTKRGAALFRDLRSEVMVDALWSETAVADHIIEWTQALDLDALRTPGDRLALVAARISILRQSYRLGNVGDQQMLNACEIIEQELLSWRENTLSQGSLCSFRVIQDPNSPQSFSGVRHEYSNPHSFRHWNMWRSLRIMLSRIQEAIWRRSWPILRHPPSGIPPPGHHLGIRRRVVNEVCVAAAYAFGDELTSDPVRGSVLSGMIMLNPLTVVGTCILEELAEVTMSPGGSRIITIDRGFHRDASNSTSRQLAWIIERVDYIAETIGVRYGLGISRFLRGESHVMYDLGRSVASVDLSPGPALEKRGLDLSIMQGVEP